ncbi:hypothetical protein [Legionella antarctica]|uniref:hypothetical protein n=1 Tax=Legionella antarctica TaxID=2708020 RepID=UPI001565BFA7|nr:hypothetical protein [Legionella antarctica]
MIAHELALFNQYGERQFNLISLSERIEADKKALKTIGSRKVALEYLQEQTSFHERYKDLDSFDSPDFFNWPNEVYRGDIYCDFGDLFLVSRLKGLKVTNIDFKDGMDCEEVPALYSDLRNYVSRCTPHNFFPDFPENGHKQEKLDYLKSHLVGLKKEFIPYVLKEVASQRVKQYCALIKRCRFDDAMKDDFIRAVYDAKLHSFPYIYKTVVDFSPTKGHQHVGDGAHFLALGCFRDMYEAMVEFTLCCEQNKPVSDVSNAAEKMVVLLPLIKSHFKNQHVNNRELIKYVYEHDGQLPGQLAVESDVGSLIGWPRLTSINVALGYLKEDTAGYIWQALWIMGFYYDERLFDAIPKTFLQNIINGKDADDFQKLGVNLIPVVSQSYPISYPFSAQEIAHNYLTRTQKPDLSMLKGNFPEAFDAFWKANKTHLINFKSPYFQELIKIVLDELQKLLEGNDLEQNFVLEFYEGYRSPFHEIQGNNSFSKQNPYIQFLIKNRKKISPVRIECIIRNLQFDSKQDSLDVIMAAFEFNERYPDELSRLLAFTDYCMFGKYMPGIIHPYWENFFSEHGKLRFNKRVMRILDFLNEKNLTKDIIKNIIFSLHDFGQLPLRDCIILYRIFDRDFGFENQHFREVLTSRIKTGLEALEDLDQKIEFLEQLIFIKESLSRFVLTDKIFINYLNQSLGQCYADKYKQDDGTKAYYQNVEPVLNRIYQNASVQDTLKIYTCFSEQIVSQEFVSRHLGQLMEPEKHDNYFSSSLDCYAGLTSLISELGQNYVDKEAMMTFISSPLSAASLDQFAEYVMNHRNRNEIAQKFNLNPRDIKKDDVIFGARCFYQQFWDLKIHQRAVVLDGLIITANEEVTEQSMLKAYQFGFDFIVNKLFPNATTNEREGFALALLESYLLSADKFERQFLLAGLFVTSNESSGKNETIGGKFALLCEHMGPAYVKLAQSIHSHPDTPIDIKKDLAHVKGRANPPQRWQLWRLLKDTLPAQEYNHIKTVGRLLGSASYNLAMACAYKDNPEMVVTLLRENASRDAKKGFIHLRKAINHCQHPTILKSKQTFLHMINEAETLSHWEINNDVSNVQYRHAKQHYDKTSLEVTVSQNKYHVHFKTCANLVNGPGFKILTRMPGNEFNELTDMTIKEAIAKAVMTKELQILLSGGVFDSDRHGSQLRVTVDGNQIYLGLYDFGEMSLEPLSQEELQSYAALVRELPKTIKTNQSIPELFQKHIQKVIDEGRAYRHLMRINKSLLALNDFKQYLTNDDLMQIVLCIMPNTHPVLNKAMRDGYFESASYAELGMTFFSTAKRTFSDFFSGVSSGQSFNQ